MGTWFNHNTALWPGLNFFLCLNILIKNSGWTEGGKVKKVEITTKLLWCTLFLQVLIIYTLTSKKKFEEAFKKRRVIIKKKLLRKPRPIK